MNHYCLYSIVISGRGGVGAIIGLLLSMGVSMELPVSIGVGGRNCTSASHCLGSISIMAAIASFGRVQLVLSVVGEVLGLVGGPGLGVGPH